MRAHQALRLAGVVFFCVGLTGCFLWRRPQPWTPNPIHNPAQAPGEFNVLWDQEDVNGFPSNPYWEAQTPRYQSTLPPLTAPQYASCVEQPYLTAPVQPGQDACTVQDTVIDTPDEFPNVLCFFYLDSKVHGHVDWTVASTGGYVSWLNLADDWDYDFRLIPRQQTAPPQQDRGITTNNNHVGDGSTPRYIEMEFASSEVADQFRTPWWQGMSQLVDPLNLPALNKYIHPSDPTQSPFAVTVGLFGLDCEHDCRSEYHPVYAMAIQLDENPNNNVWAIFVRNWGDEGFCSSLNHELNLTDQKMSLLLPWPGAKGLKAEVQQISPRAMLPTMGLLQDANGQGEGALATFSLPKPSERVVLEVVLRLQWKGGAAVRPPAATSPSLAASGLHPADEGEQDAERFLHNLETAAGIKKPPVVSPMAAAAAGRTATQPTKLKVQLYRRQPTAASATTGLLSKTVKTSVECGSANSANPCPLDKFKQKRDIDLWKKICSGLKGAYRDDRIAQNCAKIESLP